MPNMFEEYLHFIANRRCAQIGLPGTGIREPANPFPWMSEVMDLKKEKEFLRNSCNGVSDWRRA